MDVLKRTTKVVPFDLKAPTPKENNYLEKGLNIIHQLRFILYLQAFLGINRMYLFESKQVMPWLAYTMSGTISTCLLYFMIVKDLYAPVYIIIRETITVEYYIIMFCSMLLYKKTLRNCFRGLDIFDEMLNVKCNVSLTYNSVNRGIAWMLICTFLNVFEFVVYLTVTDAYDLAMPILYIAILAHDTEMILFCMLLRMIMQRVRLLKAHVAKMKSSVDDGKHAKENSVEKLAENALLDTTSLHRAYEVLHNCAEQLNEAMSFPLIVMFFASGLSTTLMLKNIFQASQLLDTKKFPFKGVIVFILTRCIKYSIQVIIPCLFSSITSGQVSLIRTMLHDAMNTPQLEKIERRKLKAFFQMTQDSEFAYALWGVIGLNMSLPLSYFSLCTTYLVIIIQFSKFIG